MFSNQLWILSARAIMAANLARMTGCELSGLPNALRWLVHLDDPVSIDYHSHEEGRT